MAKKISLWKLLTFVFAGLFVAALLNSISGLVSITGFSVGADYSAAEKAVDFINEYLLQGQAEATLLDVQEKNGLINAQIEIQGRVFDTYITSDGQLFFPQAIDLSSPPAPLAEQAGGTETGQIPKREVPDVKLFVMSFCPFGMQAENAMIPVVELLGEKIVVEPHFVMRVMPDGTFRALHGEAEAHENIRQLCIWKHYGQETWWKYVGFVNQNCGLSNIGECWKQAAEAVNIDIEKVESCFEQEGVELATSEQSLMESYQVRGSPTLIINDVVYNGPRTSEAYKKAICDAFENPPEECGQDLSSESTAGTVGGGSCG